MKKVRSKLAMAAMSVVVLMALVVASGFGYRAWRQHKVVAIEGAGHFAIISRETEFAAALRKYVIPLGLQGD